MTAVGSPIARRHGHVRVSSAKRRAATGVGDQLVYSLGNFVLTVLVAHWSSPTQFGAYSLAISSYLILLAATRGLIAETYIVKFSAVDATAATDHARAGLGAVLSLGVAGGVVMAAVSFALPSELTSIFLIFAALFPGLVGQDYLRYAALGLGRPGVALMSDGVVSCLQYASAAILIAFHAEDPSYFVVTWGLATLLGGIAAFLGLALRVPKSTVLGWVRRHKELAVRYAVDDVANQGGQQANSYAVAALTGLADAGGLRAAQTVFGPSAIINLGVQAAVTPELVRVLRVSSTRMKVYAEATGICLGIVAAAWGIAALAAPVAVGDALFGPTWSLAKPLIIYLGIAQVANGLRVTPMVGLRALGAAIQTLRARTIALVLGLAVTLAGAVADGARGVAIAYAIVSPAQVLIWWWQFEVALRHHRRQRARDDVNRAWAKLTQPPDLPEYTNDVSTLR